MKIDIERAEIVSVTRPKGKKSYYVVVPRKIASLHRAKRYILVECRVDGDRGSAVYRPSAVGEYILSRHGNSFRIRLPEELAGIASRARRALITYDEEKLVVSLN